MPASKAQQRATNKYIAKAYDRINLTVAKGKRETIQAHAETRSESVNGFINRAIEETMERDSSGNGPICPVDGPRSDSVAGVVSETMETAQRAADAAGEAAPQFIARAVETQAQRDELGRKMKGGKASE